MTEQQAHKHALEASRRQETAYFVIWDFDDFAFASDEDLETFYNGTRDDQIRACYYRGKRED